MHVCVSGGGVGGLSGWMGGGGECVRVSEIK